MKYFLRFLLAGFILSPAFYAYIYKDQLDFKAYVRDLGKIVESPVFIAAAVSVLLLGLFTLRAGRASRRTAAAKREQLKKKVLGK